MEKRDKTKMKNDILQKIGVDLNEFNKPSKEPAHECDNIPNPLSGLSLEELYFLQENNYFLDDDLYR